MSFLTPVLFSAGRVVAYKPPVARVDEIPVNGVGTQYELRVRGNYLYGYYNGVWRRTYIASQQSFIPPEPAPGQVSFIRVEKDTTPLVTPCYDIDESFFYLGLPPGHEPWRSETLWTRFPVSIT